MDSQCADPCIYILELATSLLIAFGQLHCYSPTCVHEYITYKINIIKKKDFATIEIAKDNQEAFLFYFLEFSVWTLCNLFSRCKLIKSGHHWLIKNFSCLFCIANELNSWNTNSPRSSTICRCGKLFHDVKLLANVFPYAMFMSMTPLWRYVYWVISFN